MKLGPVHNIISVESYQRRAEVREGNDSQVGLLGKHGKVFVTSLDASWSRAAFRDWQSASKGGSGERLRSFEQKSEAGSLRARYDID